MHSFTPLASDLIPAGLVRDLPLLMRVHDGLFHRDAASALILLPIHFPPHFPPRSRMLVMDEFSPEQIVAIAGAIKGTREKAAKDLLKDGSTASVDFICRVSGTVQKGQGTPSGISTRPATVPLNSVPVVCAVLRKLKIGSKRLSDALAAIDPFAGPDEEFDAVFAHAAAEHAKDLPPVESVSPAKAGTVTSNVTVSLC